MADKLILTDVSFKRGIYGGLDYLAIATIKSEYESSNSSSVQRGMKFEIISHDGYSSGRALAFLKEMIFQIDPRNIDTSRFEKLAMEALNGELTQQELHTAINKLQKSKI